MFNILSGSHLILLIKTKSLGFLLLVCLFFYSAIVYSENNISPIDVYIYDRPPLFNINSSTDVSGLVATPTAQIFETAKIPFRWKIAASKTILQIIEQNEQPLCATGWFKNAKREQYAKYTLPIYQDGKRVILVRSNDSSLEKYKSFRELFADKNVKVGLKNGYSYGPYIDELLMQLSPNKVMTNQDGEGMIRMLVGGRFDYYMLVNEQAEYLLDKSENKSMIVTREMSDAAEGSSRYILCSKKTDNSIINKLNAAIESKGKSEL